MNFSNFGTVMPTPTILASAVTASEVSDTQLRITCTIGNGIKRIIVAKLTSSGTSIPVDNNTYTDNAVFASGSNLGNANYVVYKGTSNTVLITGLVASTSYTFYVYEINQKQDGTERYSAGASVAQTTLPPQIAPTTQASLLVFTGDRLLTLTRGNGGYVLILAKVGAVDSNPVDNVSYTAGAFGSGSQIGTGNYVVYIGTAASCDILSLTYGTTYGIRAYEFNLASGNPKYNTSTVTGNPISATTPSVQTYYSYKDTAFLTRRNAISLQTSREFSQVYPIGDYISATKHWVYLIAEGDGTNLRGIDRSIRYYRALADDPTLKASWHPESPTNSDGDTPSVLDMRGISSPVWSAGTTYSIGDVVQQTSGGSSYKSLTNSNIGNTPGSSPSNWVILANGYQNWGIQGSLIDSGGGNLVGFYVANPNSAGRYSVFKCTSTDDGETIVRGSDTAVITESSSRSIFYFHPNKDGADWYAFAQNYYAAGLVEGHLFITEIYHSTDGVGDTWTKISGSTDVLSGRSLTGAVDISQWWKESGKYWAYISVNDTGVVGAYNSRPEGSTVYLSTSPVGKRILLISWTDWNNFNTNFVIERIIYETSQQDAIDTRTWCQKRTFGSDIFFVSMNFLWKGQTLLNGNLTMEPMDDGKIISTKLTSSGNTVVGSEIYPGYILKFFKPHQSHLDDTFTHAPRPIEVFSNTNGTVVGSPTLGRMNSVQAVNDGFVTFPNFTYDTSYLSVKVVIDDNALSTTYGICGMDTDVGGGQHGWHIRKAGQYKFEVWIYSSDNVHYKRYRCESITASKAQNDATSFNIIGFEFKNGTLKLRVDYDLDVAVTKVVDDSFTTINQTNEVFRMGAIYPTTNDEMYSQGVVGSCLIFSGVSNVTDDHWLNQNLIGY